MEIYTPRVISWIHCTGSMGSHLVSIVLVDTESVKKNVLFTKKFTMLQNGNISCSGARASMVS